MIQETGDAALPAATDMDNEDDVSATATAAREIWSLRAGEADTVNC